MANEVPPRSRRKAHAGDVAGERGREHSPLQARAKFLENWNWQLIDRLNEGACERGRAQHGHNSETYHRTQAKWEEARAQELTLDETLNFLRQCHRAAPFLFFNGNTFAEVARRIVDVLLAEFPLVRRREAASLAAHYIAGVLDHESMARGLSSMVETADFAAGDRVRTLRGSLRGIVKRIRPDGRVVWLPAGRKMELIAQPEDLLLD